MIARKNNDPASNDHAFAPSAEISAQPGWRRTTAQISSPSTSTTPHSSRPSGANPGQRSASAHSTGWVITLTPTTTPRALTALIGRSPLTAGPIQCKAPKASR
jgi:hypothetical protein